MRILRAPAASPRGELLAALAHPTDDSCRVADDEGVIWYVAGNNCPGPMNAYRPML